ncbi:MAG: 6,7-dimethyl-8-ribityllumazine synthase [Phycisphaerales bacterium]
MHRQDDQHRPNPTATNATPEHIPPPPPLRGPIRIAAIASRYHIDITAPMLADARQTLERKAPAGSTLEVIPAPGSFEIPTLAAVAAESGRFDAIITLGCIIKGQTHHDEIIAHTIAAEVARIAVATRTPIALGILTVLNLDQARDRALGPLGRKGAETMEAAIETLAALQTLQMPDRTTPPSTQSPTHTPGAAS